MSRPRGADAARGRDLAGRDEEHAVAQMPRADRERRHLRVRDRVALLREELEEHEDGRGADAADRAEQTAHVLDHDARRLRLSDDARKLVPKAAALCGEAPAQPDHGEVRAGEPADEHVAVLVDIAHVGVAPRVGPVLREDRERVRVALGLERHPVAKARGRESDLDARIQSAYSRK